MDKIQLSCYLFSKDIKEQVMQAATIFKPSLLGLCALLLVGCEEGSGPGSSGFKSQYMSARTALESGKYARAATKFAKLLEKAGPLQDRIRLEYAHSLLRNGDYGEAAQQARYLADGQEDQSRSAALAVLGTAEHEIANEAIRLGKNSTGKSHLLTAKGAIEEVLKNHPDLDPLGALAGRLTTIKTRLKAIG